MASYLNTTAPLTSKAISKESEKAFKFKAKTKLLTGLITSITGTVSLLTPGDTITAAGIYPAGTKVVSVDVAKEEAVLDHNAEKEGAAENLEVTTPVFKPYIFTSLPARSDFAEYITGSFFSEWGGTLEVQQTFEFPARTQVDDVAEALEGVNWNTVTKVALTEGEGQAGTSIGFQVAILAPTFRLVFKNETEKDSKAVRIYGRASEKGKV